MRWSWSCVEPVQSVVPAVNGHAAPSAPHRSNHIDGLPYRLHGLAGCALRPAHGGRGGPPSASEPELEAAAAQQVEGCSGFGQAGRRPEWEVGYVGKEAHLPALAE